MKRIIFFLLGFIFLHIPINAETLVTIIGSYNNHCWKKSYNVEAVTNDKALNALLIQTKAEHSDECYIKVPASKLKAFHDALKLTRDKLFQLGGEALLNHTQATSSKLDDVKFPLVAFTWKYGNSYYNSLNNLLKFTFEVTKGLPFVTASKQITANSNEFITERYSFTFTVPQDMDELIKLTDIETINSILLTK